MYDAGGLHDKHPGVELLAVGMSCPTVASSRDVRPDVSTADAMLLVSNGRELSQPRLSPAGRFAQESALLRLTNRFQAGGIELSSMDSFVSIPVTGVQGARGLPEGRLSPILDNGNAESAAERGADQPRRQSARLSRTNTGEETAGTSIDIRDTEMLSKIHYVIPDRMWTSILSGNRSITVDLQLVANIVDGSHKQASQLSASRVLDNLRKKDSWKLGTRETILHRFAANSVPLLHKTTMLLDLKMELSVILEEWTKETPPLSPKTLQFPKFWPLDYAKADVARTAPALTREWTLEFLSRQYVSGEIEIPERTLTAIRAYSAQPLDHLLGHLTDQCNPNQPAPPKSQPTRPKPITVRTMSNGNTPSFTDDTAEWFERARCTLSFSEDSGGVHLKATLANLRNLLNAGPKTDLAGLRGIATDRRKKLDPEKVKRHFEDGGQRAEAAYYASVLAQLYSGITKLREIRADGKLTGEIRPNRIGALGFPAGTSPQETHSAVVTWGKFHMGTWNRDNPVRLAMAAYVKNTAEPNREPRNVHTALESHLSVRLSPTHATDSAKRARQWEVAERIRACMEYSRGAIPSWMRNYSPLDDVQFIRNMTELEQLAYWREITVASLPDFIATSTDEMLQEREQAEVLKYTNVSRTPPWYAPKEHTETPNFAVRDSNNPHARPSSSSRVANQEDNSSRDWLERFQTSPVTASNLPDENLAPNQARVDWSAGQVQNRFTLLRASDGEEDDDQNEETDLYDPDDETSRMFLQQPSAGANVRTLQPTFPPAAEFRPPNWVVDSASVVKALDRVSWDELIAPARMSTMRDVPCDLQEEVLGAMQDILKNMNDALEGPEV